MTVKSPLLSKTIWVNVLTLVLIVINRSQEIVPTSVVEPLAIVSLPIINMGLRWVTKEPINAKLSKE